MNRSHPDRERINLRRESLPEIIYNPDLPIMNKKDDIVQAIRSNQVTIITGETGSGKTTQLPKICLEAGRGLEGIIGCTQPRRIAAVTAAHRIAEELKEDVGRSVGYKIRFDEKIGPRPLIKVMTDGILLVETQSDRLLRRYDTIIVDEAHERNLNIDFVLGILLSILPKRPELRIIITSATLDTGKFTRAFGNAPVIEVSGRMYSVDVHYRPIDPELEESGDVTYIDAAVDAVAGIRKGWRPGDMGDILIFMPTEQDIRETCDILDGRYGGEAIIFPLFARLPWHDQRRVFQSTALTKIIVATNIAETSITIPNIRYVIDTGLARVSHYNARSRSTSLPIRPISRSSADQRKGRCGRVRNGICIRLYSEENYQERPRHDTPEILRSNLAGVILQMLSLNLGDIFDFPFIDRPLKKNIVDAVDILLELGAIQKARKDDSRNRTHPFTLTDRGRTMARLPIDPRVSRMIIEGRHRNCLDEVAIIASALSIADPRESPSDKRVQADQMHAPFKDPTSDFTALLRIWNKFHTTLDSLKTQNRIRKFCREHFLSYNRMREWRDVYKQIIDILEEAHEKSTARPHPQSAGPDDLHTAIHKSILSGYLGNIAEKKEKNLYHASKGLEPMIFPGSSLFNRGGQWIVAVEWVQTSRLYARIVANIEPGWIEEIGKDHCRFSYADPHWEKNLEDVAAFEKVTLFGLTIIPRRSVSFSRISPDEASPLFIRQGLIPGELKSRFPFLHHNLELLERLSDLESKTRRHDLIDEEAIYRFYAERLPGIANVSSLKTLIQQKGGGAFLFMKESDVLLQTPDHDVLSSYPDHAVIDGVELPLSYRFEPGQIHDGITLKIPAGILSNISVNEIDWAVPGILRDKVYLLLKGLPKEYRKKLPPLPHLCDVIMAELPCGDRSLLTAMGRFIRDRFNVSVPASAWPSEQLPDHLKMLVAVVDGKNQILASSRDIQGLQKNLFIEEESAAFEKARRAWELAGLTDWTFDDIPEKVPLKNAALPVGFAFPALEADDADKATVKLRLFKRHADAMAAHPRGIKRLYEIIFNDDLKYLRKTLNLTGTWKVWGAAFGGIKTLEKLLYDKVVYDLFELPIRTRKDFISHGKQTRKKILLRGAEVLHLAAPVVEIYHATTTALDRFEKANFKNSMARQFIADLRQELNRLIPEPFLQIYTENRLANITRYLRALAIRAERGVLHLEKALSKTAEIKLYKDKLTSYQTAHPDFSSPERKTAIDDFAWMIEEYKVSLFAQELKTPYPVSKKRLDEKIKEIEMMT